MTKHDEARTIEEALDRIRRDQPSLKPIADAFQVLLVSRAVLKAGMPDCQGRQLPSPDAKKLSEGVPVLTGDELAGLMDPWGERAASTIAPLARAFPGLEAEIRRLKESLDKGESDLGHCMRALMKDDDAELGPMASRLVVPLPVLRFLLGQILKPFVEKKTQPLHAAVRRLPWHRGYCPVCGAFPEITYLQGEGGQRWLRCSLCGHEWQFNRMLCPRCETQGQKKNLIYVEGRRDEFAELCASCGRYIVGLDLREHIGESITAASAIGLVHLDIMAQERGYSPVASCAWNMVESSHGGPEGKKLERQ